MKYSMIISLVSIMLFSGCARLNSIARSFDVNHGEGKLIDAKQRAIIVFKHKDTNKTMVCAEPSPDALSAYAAQLATEGRIPEKAALKLAGSLQESTSYIGLRTQSIQLLRDAMYRNCEAYANGALDEAQYGIASRRYQRSMVALLAIEQLTGAIRVPPITITTEGATEVAKSISEMQSVSDAIEEEINQYKKEIKETNDEINTTNNETNTTNKSDKLKELNDKKAKLKKKKSSREKNKKHIGDGIANARGIMTTGKSYAKVSGTGVITRNDQHIENVSDTVYKIFENLNGADDFTQICLSYLAVKKNYNPDFNKICMDRLNIITESKKVHNALLNTFNNLISKKDIRSAKLILKVLNNSTVVNKTQPVKYEAIIKHKKPN